MMGIFALILCSAFVLYLLSIEKRGSRQLSKALWIPTLWMLIVASRPVSTWFYDSQQVGHPSDLANNESGNPIDRITLAALGAGAIIVLITRRYNWMSAVRKHSSLFVVLGYMLLSTLWSDITLIALRRLSREWIGISVAMVIASEVDPRRAVASVLRRSAYTLLPFSVVMIKYFPTFGRQYSRWLGVEMWTGVARQKNELGRLCMICIFFLLFALFEQWKQRKPYNVRLMRADIVVLGIGFFLMIGSQSMTSLTTLLIGCGIFTALGIPRQRIPLGAIQLTIVLLITFGITLPFVGSSSSVASMTSMMGRDSTFTGRTEVWDAVVPVMEEQPILGHGFASFWTDARRKLFDIPTAHNGYLDVLLELGFAGMLCIVFWILSIAKGLYGVIKHEPYWAFFGISLLIMSLIYNATESAINSLTEYVTAIVVIVAIAVPAKLTAPVMENHSPTGLKLTAWNSAEASQGRPW